MKKRKWGHSSFDITTDTKKMRLEHSSFDITMDEEDPFISQPPVATVMIPGPDWLKVDRKKSKVKYHLP